MYLYDLSLRLGGRFGRSSSDDNHNIGLFLGRYDRLLLRVVDKELAVMTAKLRAIQQRQETATDGPIEPLLLPRIAAGADGIFWRGDTIYPT